MPAAWDEDRVDALSKAIISLLQLSSDDVVVVEGPNDARSLRRLGLSARVIVCSREVSLPDLELRASTKPRGRRLVLLPDFDKEGRDKMRRWRSSFPRGRDVDTRTWSVLRSLLKREGIGVEGMAGLAERLGLLRGDMWLGPDERVS